MVLLIKAKSQAWLNSASIMLRYRIDCKAVFHRNSMQCSVMYDTRGAVRQCIRCHCERSLNSVSVTYDSGLLIDCKVRNEISVRPVAFPFFVLRRWMYSAADSRVLWWLRWSLYGWRSLPLCDIS